MKLRSISPRSSGSRSPRCTFAGGVPRNVASRPKRRSYRHRWEHFSPQWARWRAPRGRGGDVRGMPGMQCDAAGLSGIGTGWVPHLLERFRTAAPGPAAAPPGGDSPHRRALRRSRRPDGSRRDLRPRAGIAPRTAAGGDRHGAVRAGRRPARPSPGDGGLMDRALVPDGRTPWLDADGPVSHLVLSTRVRLARNLAERPSGPEFAARSERRGRLSKLLPPTFGAGVRLAAAARRAPACHRLWLHERQLVSRELAGLDPAGRSGAAPQSSLPAARV